MIDDTMTFAEAQAVLSAAGLYVHSASYDGTQWHVRLRVDEAHVDTQADTITGVTETAPTLGQALEGARGVFVRWRASGPVANDPCPVCGKPECGNVAQS